MLVAVLKPSILIGTLASRWLDVFLVQEASRFASKGSRQHPLLEVLGWTKKVVD